MLHWFALDGLNGADDDEPSSDEAEDPVIHLQLR